MITQEWRNEVDRTGWEPGEWDSEPDRKQWMDEATGLPCLAVRAHGHWCGYVGVPEGHPWYGKSCNDIEGDHEVHGGLTYADFCQGRVCHVVEDGEHDKPWWLGFDCGHSWDLDPRRRMTDLKYGFSTVDPIASYRSLRYVEGECAALAQQVKGASQ